MTPLEAAVLEVTAVLDSLSIAHMLVGGLAVAVWGEPRATLDVDMVVWVEPEDLERSIARLCERLRALPTDPVGFARETRVLPVQTSPGVRADLIFARFPYERQAIGRASTKEIAGKAIRVAAIEDLILMKLTSERERDAEDARRLLRRFSQSVDRAYLEPLVTELAEALARPDMLRMFHEQA
ncbi:MAG: DUF6036 family nucleotidyltransferase [Acidobacteriota bacterium]